MTAVLDPAQVGQSTKRDYVVTSDQPRPRITDVAVPWSMSVNYHLCADTPVVVCVYTDADRITVGFGGATDDLTLFVPADQIDRLMLLLRTARRRLSSTPRTRG
jgi:hypothetical protein